MSTPKYLIDKESPVPARAVAITLLVILLGLALLLFYPISLVFSGQWKLHQKIDLAQAVAIDIRAVGLNKEGIKNLTGLQVEEIIPIGTISIRYYTIFMILGILLGYFLVLYLAQFHYIAGTIIDRLLVGLIVFGILGARLFYVIFNLPTFIEDPLIIITDIANGGLAFFGMFIAGVAYIWVYCARFKFNFYEFLDFLAPGVLFGQVIARWGNFFNYEAYGPETPLFWKMMVPETANYYSDLNSTYFHPTFLYEIIPNAFLLIIILFFYKNLTSKHSGLVFGVYAFGYGIIRFITEFYRLDSLKIYLPFSIPAGYLGKIDYLLASQLVAALLFLVGCFIILTRNKILYIKKNMSEFRI
jgi:phosphatidylglycerol:prolipoprotein diacylglycerol transferase